jgi:antibiotic biosynthesis monooxygenase (ABM) superfamily enzyme
MILHVVLLQPKPETTREEIYAALEQIKALQQKVPGILDVQVGENLNSSNNKGYTYGFAMRFVDEAHLKAYGPHPDHQIAGAELVRICQSIIDFDISLPL